MKVGKVVKWSLLVIVLLVVAGVLGGWAMIDRIAKTAVEKGGTYAMQVDTKVDKVSLSLLKGELTIDGLQVDNPQGYQAPYLMKSGRFEMAVEPASVLGSPVKVGKFVIDGFELNIESKGTINNISQIMANLKRLGSDQPADQKKQEGKKVQIDRILIKNVVAHIQLPIGGEAGKITVKVPQIELNNVSSDKGVPVDQLFAKILPAIVSAVVESGKGLIPADLAGTLNTDAMGAAKALGGNAAKLLETTTGNIGHLPGAATQQLDKAKSGLEKILGGKKP